MGIGFRLLATLFFLWLLMTVNRCGPTTEPTGVFPAVTPAVPASLAVEILPGGAVVEVDGQFAGTTPLSVELVPGQHSIRVRLDGFEPLEQEVSLEAAETAAMRGELAPIVTPAVPSIATEPARQGVASPALARLPDLVVKQVKIELESAARCDYASTQLGTRVLVANEGNAKAGPFEIDVNGSRERVAAGLAVGETTSLWYPGYVSGSETAVLVDAALQVEEADEDNNGYAQMVPIPTLPPACTPAPTDAPTNTPVPPTPTPTRPASRVTVREGQVTIPTYPFADYITADRNETFDMTYSRLDRGAYDASNPVAVDVTYGTLVLENEYLQLTFLPDVGGRLYEVIFKPTGHRETYRNPVLKPSPWGPPEQGWWLAAGGLEWCLPVEEHGYEWGVPWIAEVDEDSRGATVTLRDTATGDRLRAEIAVRLEAGAGSFAIRHRVENPTGAPLPVKYWSNAMLAPGGQNRPSAELRFVLPETVTSVTVHSRGDETLPATNERMSWPVVNEEDMSRLGNWNRWLGFFEDPAAGGFIAVYDEGYDEGMVRVFPAEVAKGAKVFALGWGEPIPSGNWTDDGSSYVELHAGLAPTFGDSVTLPAGGQVEWTETWYPVVGLGGLCYGNQLAGLNLQAGGGLAQVGVATTRPWSGDAVLLLDGREVWRAEVALAPGQAFRETVSLGDGVPQSGELALRLEDRGGGVGAEYSAAFNLR